jgi:hypothetical protein
MTEHEASRTLVKSPPELWAECSDAASLARHLGQFGEICITRLEPETAVAWEGEHASVTVRLEPSGWGTRVILTAREVAKDLPVGPGEVPAPSKAAAITEPEYDRSPAPEPNRAVEAAGPARGPNRAVEAGHAPQPPSPSPRRRAFGRWFGLLRRPPAPAGMEPALAFRGAPEQAVRADRRPETDESVGTVDSKAALACALDSLGRAHHRPFSRT